MAPRSLQFVFDGWEGYNTSLCKAIESRTAAELSWQPTEGLRSVGAVAAHIAFARPAWFARMDAPGAKELNERYVSLRGPDKEWLDPKLLSDPTRLVEMLSESWKMVNAALQAWTVDDLEVGYRHEYEGETYKVSRQWTVWRILSHDIHHGGQICEMLYQQGIEVPELGDLGGHLTEPPLWED